MKNPFGEFGAMDLVLASCVVAASGSLVYALCGLHDEAVVSGINDVWFQSDLKRVFENMTDRYARGHYRVQVHPLYSLFTYPPTFALRKLGIAPLHAVQIVTAAIAALYVLTYYALLRAAGCARLDSMVFSILGGCSAAALFWLSVPESYGLGATSIAVGLSLSAVAAQRYQPAWKYVVVSALTLSITVTNWMVGILTTLTGNTLKRTCSITVISLSVVALFWVVEKQLFPTALFFVADRGEGRYLFLPTVPRIISVLNTFLFHTMMAPTINVTGTTDTGWPLLSMQSSYPGSTGPLGMVGVIVWSLLLGLGIWTLLMRRIAPGLQFALGLTLFGQLSLHLVYGEETFLYSLHFLPLLMTMSALSTLTELRVTVLALALLLIPIAGINNWRQFNEAISLATSPRHEVKTHMQMRPQDSWPRGLGHVLLTRPGSSEGEKSYHEPGGNFSPAVGTFGISLWFTDSTGKPVMTSETIPLRDLSQQFVWSDTDMVPGLTTTTPSYTTHWSQGEWGEWRLDLTVPNNISLNPILMIRSVGPAGGPIRELHWNGKTLSIDGRWSLSIQPPPESVQLGEETSSGWKTSTEELRTIKSQAGWAFARISLGKGAQWTILLHDEQPGLSPEIFIDKTTANLQIDLPDYRFKQSLNSQIAHLMMGLVGRETRPGDPTNYPLPWQRDGAYVLVALARAGKIETARILSRDFAEKDYFGGFGPEADAPGLSIWALRTVADQLRQNEFDQWLWPHISRKAELIEEMLHTSSNIHKKVEGSIVPKYRGTANLSLVAEPARDGLIVGKMDNHPPHSIHQRHQLSGASSSCTVRKSSASHRRRTALVRHRRADQESMGEWF
jgi:hypothetical protein